MLSLLAILALLQIGASSRIVAPSYKISFYEPDAVDNRLSLRQLLDSSQSYPFDIKYGSQEWQALSRKEKRQRARAMRAARSQQQQQQQQSIQQQPQESSSAVMDEPSKAVSSNGKFSERSRPTCGHPSSINELRKKHGEGQIVYAQDLENLCCDLNNKCGFSHACAKTAEILYTESGYGEECHVQRAVKGWENSPGHFRIATGNRYGKFGCCTTKSGKSLIRRCAFVS